MTIYFDKYGRVKGWSSHEFPRDMARLGMIVEILFVFFAFPFIPVITLINWNSQGRFGVRSSIINFIIYLLLNVAWLFLFWCFAFGETGKYQPDLYNAPYEYWDFNAPEHQQ